MSQARFIIVAIIVSGVIGTWLIAQEPDTPADPVVIATIRDCNIGLVNEVDVSAQESGVLIEVLVEEGVSVSLGDVLAKIDDRDAQVRRVQVELQKEVAEKEASNDINIRAAEKAAEVADAELVESESINAESPGAVPPTKIRRERLTAERSRLQIDVAQLEFDVAALTSKIRQAELDQALITIDRRQLASPIAGEVERRFKDIGEWVQAGDAVFQVVRMDKLRVEGFVVAAEYPPLAVIGKPVRVTYTVFDKADKAQPRKQFVFTGKIGFASNQIQAGGEYRVWAEVENRKYRGQWVLRPGATLDMQLLAE
ncbi:MAG: efflux RND transporter periplasmic adaptor subunit [Pirellulaceae bacterium]